MTDGDHNYLKQHKSVEFLLFWSQFSSSDNRLKFKNIGKLPIISEESIEDISI